MVRANRAVIHTPRYPHRKTDEALWVNAMPPLTPHTAPTAAPRNGNGRKAR
uniref:Uncharacterized protein n=1 Tax=Anguilla anguilla TaxID=7936 RepID=A0A0E9T6I4_ANGAN